MLATIIEILIVTLVLIGIVKEEKLIELEDKIADEFAKVIAKIIVAKKEPTLNVGGKADARA